jgi:putative tricarboxylic transport membrane protein
MVDHILLGLQVVLQPDNILYCFLGAVLGTLIGVLPGLGPVGAISILLPTTFHLTPLQAIIMVSGIYYGAQYGGSITSILLNIPGESSSIVTCIDGYQMAKKGRAGPALGISAFGSFIGGTVSILLLMVFALPLVKLGLTFGPPEYFSLMIVGIVLLTSLSSKSVINALVAGAFGIFLSTIGIDPMSGNSRFTFKAYTLMDGIGLVPVAMGLFGIAEILMNIETGLKQETYETRGLTRSILPTVRDWLACKWPIVRGTFIGFFLGVLPGGGAILASFASYSVEKRFSRHPETFGRGAIEGVAGPETANNSGAQGSFVPLLAFGIPCNVVMALLLSIFILNGITPGPLLMRDHPNIFWGLVMSMYLGNVMLLVLNVPLIGIWVKFLKIPYVLFFPFIILFCLVGVYSLNNNVNELFIMILFGVAGYLMRKFEYDPAVLILAMVLGPMMETAFRRSLIMYPEGVYIFFKRPISLGLLLLAALLLFYPIFRRRRRFLLKDAGED